MKTAMQELIDEMKEYNIILVKEGIEPNPLINMLKHKAEKLLKKEKEQIMNAYCDGAKGGANGNKGQHENGWVSIQMRNKYYNETYNN